MSEVYTIKGLDFHTGILREKDDNGQKTGRKWLVVKPVDYHLPENPNMVGDEQVYDPREFSEPRESGGVAIAGGTQGYLNPHEIKLAKKVVDKVTEGLFNRLDAPLHGHMKQYMAEQPWGIAGEEAHPPVLLLNIPNMAGQEQYLVELASRELREIEKTQGFMPQLTDEETRDNFFDEMIDGLLDEVGLETELQPAAHIADDDSGIAGSGINLHDDDDDKPGSDINLDEPPKGPKPPERGPRS